MNESKATRFQRVQRRARLQGLLAAAVALSILALTPLAAMLGRWAASATSGLGPVAGTCATAGLFVLVVTVLCEGAAFSAARRGCRATAGAPAEASAAQDALVLTHLQTGAVTAAVAGVMAGLVLGSVRLVGPAWWLVAASALALCWAGLLRFGPLTWARLTAARPLPRDTVRQRLESLTRNLGVPIAGIHEWAVAGGSRSTAFVSGTGRSRQVFVSSAILREWADDEIAVVVAHELAHHAHHDLWRSLGLNAGVLGLGLAVADLAVRMLSGPLGLSGPGDPAALPLITLVSGAVWIAATPLRHAQSRAHERRADWFALDATGSVDAFRTAIRRLGAERLAEERPSRLTRWFHHAHPSVRERLALADRYSAEQRRPA